MCSFQMGLARQGRHEVHRASGLEARDCCSAIVVDVRRDMPGEPLAVVLPAAITEPVPTVYHWASPTAAPVDDFLPPRGVVLLEMFDKAAMLALRKLCGAVPK